MTLPPTANWYSAGPSGTFSHAPWDYAGSTLDQNGAINYGFVGRKMVQIIDGTSNTFFAGESRKNLANLGQYQGDDNEGYTSGWDWDSMRRTSQAPLPDDRTGPGELFGSSHTGGFNMVFCDGSVRFITYSIDLPSFSAMGTTMAGDTISNLP